MTTTTARAETPITARLCLACGSTHARPFAKSRDIEYVTTPDSFTFYQCQDCQALFIDPVPINELSRIYPPNYYAFHTEHRGIVHRIKTALDRRFFSQILKRIPGESLAALDVGGGAGQQMDVLKEVDSRVQLTQVVDLDSKAAQAATARGHKFFCGRIEDFEMDQRYDLILLLNLIEHVANPAAILSQARNLLAPQGVILVKTPNYDSLDARIFRNLNWGGYHCPRHWVIFTKESFVRLATECELKVKEFSYTQGAPFWAISSLAWLADHKLITVTAQKPATFHPLFPFLSALFAGFDFFRRWFAKTSQMFFILGK